MISIGSGDKILQVYIGGQRIHQLWHQRVCIYRSYVKTQQPTIWITDVNQLADEDILSNTEWNVN